MRPKHCERVGAFAGGWIEERLGARTTVLCGLIALMVLAGGMLLMESKASFWVLGVMFGLFFGPAQAASRSLMAQLAPPAEVAAYFGLLAFWGRATGFLGPAALALVTDAANSQRAGMAVVLLGVGVAILASMPRQVAPLTIR
jgi:UMF1 family MFS transporter